MSTIRMTAVALGVVVLLAGCNKQALDQPAVAIEKGDVSATCGMYIANAPGPRAEAYIAGLSKPLKFGSTRDLFAFAADSEMEHRVQTLYVQDVARIDWKHPSNDADTFIDARKAYYVAWQPLKGSMGPTFASFATRSNAKAFIRKNGGELLRFGQITPELVSALGYKCPVRDSVGGGSATACVTLPGQATDPMKPAAGSRGMEQMSSRKATSAMPR